MSCSGDNHRELLDGHGTFILEPCFLKLEIQFNLTNLKYYICTLNELIDIRDGIKEYQDFTKEDIFRFILNSCTH